MLRIDSPFAKQIGYTSDNFEKMGSFIWDMRLPAGYLSVDRLVPKASADRPIAHLIYGAERLNLEIRFYSFNPSLESSLVKVGFKRHVEECGTTYLHNRARLNPPKPD